MNAIKNFQGTNLSVINSWIFKFLQMLDVPDRGRSGYINPVFYIFESMRFMNRLLTVISNESNDLVYLLEISQKNYDDWFIMQSMTLPDIVLIYL